MKRTMTTQLIIRIRPVEINGKHWVGMIMNGRGEMGWRGPFPHADAATGTADRIVQQADRLARHWRRHAANPPAWMQATPGILDLDTLVAYGPWLEATPRKAP